MTLDFKETGRPLFGQYQGTCSGDSVDRQNDCAPVLCAVACCCCTCTCSLRFLHMVKHFRIVSYRIAIFCVISYRIVSLMAVSCHHYLCVLCSQQNHKRWRYSTIHWHYAVWGLVLSPFIIFAFWNISVSFCLRAPRYRLTLWCALGLLVGGTIQVPQLQLQLQFLLFGGVTICRHQHTNCSFFKDLFWVTCML